jgi:hypothetical protein
MAKIDTSFAQTKEQREAIALKKRKALAAARMRANRLRREANARPRGTAPVHKIRLPKKNTVRRKIATPTRLDEIVDAQVAGFHTPAEQRAARNAK